VGAEEAEAAGGEEDPHDVIATIDPAAIRDDNVPVQLRTASYSLHSTQPALMERWSRSLRRAGGRIGYWPNANQKWNLP
jgi:hypothetical protein